MRNVSIRLVIISCDAMLHISTIYPYLTLKPANLYVDVSSGFNCPLMSFSFWYKQGLKVEFRLHEAVYDTVPVGVIRKPLKRMFHDQLAQPSSCLARII